MVAQLPQLAALGLRILGDDQLGVVLPDLRRRVQDDVRVSVTGQPDIKAGSGQGLHLAAEDLLVRGRLGQQVVRVDKGTPLQLAQPVDLDAGELRVPALPRSQDPPVAIDQVSGGVDACRHDPPELIKGIDQAVDLRLRVLLRVALVGDQLVDLSPDEPDRRFCHCLSFLGRRRNAWQDLRQEAAWHAALRSGEASALRARDLVRGPRAGAQAL